MAKPALSSLDPSSPAAQNIELAIVNLSVFYGEAKALDAVSLQVKKGRIAAVLGSNGAGKTTLLRTLTGMIKPTAGEIILKGERIAGCSPNEIIRKGIASVPEGGELFGPMSVWTIFCWAPIHWTVGSGKGS